MDEPTIYQSIGTAIASTVAAITGWIAYQLKKEKVNCLNEEQVRLLIEDKLKEVTLSQKFINDRLDRIESKLDRVMEYLLDDARKRGGATSEGRASSKRI